MSSTIETLERELGEAQTEREVEQRAVVRAETPTRRRVRREMRPGPRVLRPILRWRS